MKATDDFPIHLGETIFKPNTVDTTTSFERVDDEITAPEQDEITSDEISTLETDEESTNKEDKSSSTNASEVSTIDRDEKVRRIVSGYFISVVILLPLVSELIFVPMLVNDGIKDINVYHFVRGFCLLITAFSSICLLAFNPEHSDSIENMLSKYVSYEEIIRNWWK